MIKKIKTLAKLAKKTPRFKDLNNNKEYSDKFQNIVTKLIKKQYKPRDPNYNTMYYHKHMLDQLNVIYALVVLCIVHYIIIKNSGKCKVVKHFKYIAQLEDDELNLTQSMITS